MPPPDSVKELVARFERNLASYRSGKYNETQVRREFVDPLFEALGWDVTNRQGYAEAYKDVIHEDSIRIGALVKAPDYCFRIGGTRKFFLETKKPSVNIKSDTHPAYQLRRYAWSAKLPLSILTDFEEFAVYDCRTRPSQSDKASKSRIMYLKFDEYLDRWDEIAEIFARDAILKGSFDKFADSAKGKRGTAEVDDEFLKEIESWRETLAKNIALRNPQLSSRDLNFAVQRTIDRLVFLRICEDRGIEPYGRLQALGNGGRIYPRLCELFRAADDRYNSGLFHFKKEKGRSQTPDELSLSLSVDDKILKSLLKRMYYPESPYEFSVLPADILGQVYERFLGKVIRLTAGHQAKIEEKPEVRKAGGVYYTPTYIVDYIVENTVGKLLEDSNPKKASKLRILDPACGSGSFLIGAYQLLLDWHRDWYVNDNPEKYAQGKSPVLYQGRGDEWKLTTAERKRILLNNIYGVDIDQQAVEVTKLSLLLKVLEGESEHTLSNQLMLFNERALPDLGGNIKCGNSLIAPDFYDTGQPTLFDMDETYRINAFDWTAEFPEVLNRTNPKNNKDKDNGGFDAVIGNPPYVRQESLSEFKAYFSSHYESYHGTADLCVYFIEQGLRLLRDKGLFGIIVSNSFLRATYGGPLRKTIPKHAGVWRVVDFGGHAVFANAKDTYTCIPFLCKGGESPATEVITVTSLDSLDLNAPGATTCIEIPYKRLSADAWSLKSDAESATIAKIMQAGMPLGKYVQGRMFYGVKTGFNNAFELDPREENQSGWEPELLKTFVGGQDIRQWHIRSAGRKMIVVPCGWTRSRMTLIGAPPSSEQEAWRWFSQKCPKESSHLSIFEESCRKRQDQGEFWWELRPCDYYCYLEAPKIVFPDICKGPRFSLDRSGLYLLNTAYCLGTDDRYLLGILNSRLFWFIIGNISIPFGTRGGEFRYRLIYQYMEKVPIRTIDFADPAEVARHDRMVALVERMLELNKQLQAANTAHDRTVLQRQIDATDTQIDRLVYELYNLTDEEIKIVEGESH